MEKSTCPCSRKELFSAHTYEYEPIDNEIEIYEHDEEEADDENVWPDQQLGTYSKSAKKRMRFAESAKCTGRSFEPVPYSRCWTLDMRDGAQYRLSLKGCWRSLTKEALLNFDIFALSAIDFNHCGLWDTLRGLGYVWSTRMLQ